MKSMKFEKNFFANKKSRCFILGCGPSLLDYDLSKLKNEFVFGVNLVQASGVVPDVLCVGDQLMLHDNIDKIYSKHSKVKFYVLRNILTKKNMFLKNLKNVRFVEGRQNTELVDPNLFVFNETRNGVICDLAIPSAIYLGFKEIYLLGVDGAHGKNSHFYDYKGKETKNYVETIVREEENATSYVDLVNCLDKIGVKLFTCNMDPNITPEIKKKEWKEVIK